MDKQSRLLGRLLAGYLNKETNHEPSVIPCHPERLLKTLRPCDVLLVEGNSHVSTAIKYLTRSIWSHAAVFIGFDHGHPLPPGHCFIEADTLQGVRTVGLEAYQNYHTRICRPVGLAEDDRQKMIDFLMSRLGHQYDLRNVFDLARYLFAQPPVPNRFRRQMLALGSGDPTRSICSTLIAEAFEQIRYPILPDLEHYPAVDGAHHEDVALIMHIRHHSLYVPRDFDISPYFQVIKPTIETGFNFRTIAWHQPQNEQERENHLESIKAEG